jgi:hypothetical protein
MAANLVGVSAVILPRCPTLGRLARGKQHETAAHQDQNDDRGPLHYELLLLNFAGRRKPVA